MRMPMRPDLVDEGRPDAAERGADGRRPAQLLVGAVDEHVVGHDDVAAVAHVEVLDADALRLQLFDLLQQHRRVDDDAVADDAGLVAVEDARRHEVEAEGAHVVDDGVSGVVPGRVARHDAGVLGQEIDSPALAFVAPLAADDYYYWHEFTPTGSGHTSFRV